jgi:cardiolipin synthase
LLINIFKKLAKNIASKEKTREITQEITIATLFTLLRIILTPVVIGAMLFGYWGLASIIFFIAMLTDLLDGLFARLLNQETFLGACLDPIADKILMVSCYATLAFIKIPFLKIPLWFVYFVLFRELSILLGISYLGIFASLIPVKPTFFGKFTTFAQSVFINWIFLCMFFNWAPVKTYSLLFFVVILLVVSSFLRYLHIGYKGFKLWFAKDSYR